MKTAIVNVIMGVIIILILRWIVTLLLAPSPSH